MNYFKLFNIKPIYELKAEELQPAYIALQKKYHPDNCQTIEQQLEAVEKTIEVNKGYDILNNDVLLVVYYAKTELGLELSDTEIQKELSQGDLLMLLDLQEDISNNPSKIDIYKQQLKEKTLSITLKVKQSIKEQNEQEIKSNLAKLIFFNKSLKHI